jgi:hypothetical protein
VLKGSVRWKAGRIHLNTQLIDTRTENQVWAAEYDQDLANVFLTQSGIAQKVADQLEAKVSAVEKVAIKEPPTSDLVAYDLYLRAKDLLLPLFNSRARSELLQAVDLLNQAVARDPAFFQAYCQLASTHDQLYFLGFDHTPARLALAEAAIQPRFAYAQRLAKHTWHAQKIFIEDTSITREPWLNWRLLGRPYPILPVYSPLRVTSRGVRGAGKNRRETWNTRLISTRATFIRFSRLRSVTEFSGATLKKNLC